MKTLDSHVGDLAWTEGTDQGCAIEPEKGLWLKTYAYATEPGKGDEANLCFLGLIMTANLIPTFLLEMRCFDLFLTSNLFPPTLRKTVLSGSLCSGCEKIVEIVQLIFVPNMQKVKKR